MRGTRSLDGSTAAPWRSSHLSFYLLTSCAFATCVGERAAIDFLAILPHRSDGSCVSDALRWVLIEHDEVRFLSWLKSAVQIAHSQHFRSISCRDRNRLHRRQPR